MMRQCETQMITRRFFIAGAVSFGAFHGLRAFAAPSDFGFHGIWYAEQNSAGLNE